jgi:hypothetical protein
MFFLEKSCRRFINFAFICVGSSPSQLLSPPFHGKEKRGDHDDSEYATFINFRVVKTVYTRLFRDARVFETTELCATLAMNIALQFYLCEN